MYLNGSSRGYNLTLAGSADCVHNPWKNTIKPLNLCGNDSHNKKCPYSPNVSISDVMRWYRRPGSEEEGTLASFFRTLVTCVQH